MEIIMKTMKKSVRCICLILALLMAASVFTVVQAYAEDSGKSSDIVFRAQDDDDDSENNTDLGYLSFTKLSIKAGGSKTLKYYSRGHALESWISKNTNIVRVRKHPTITDACVIYALKKGTTTVEAWDTLVYPYRCKITVTSNPSIKVSKKTFNAQKTYKVKKGKTLTVDITGKSAIVKNVYSSTKKSVAKVTSSTSAKSIKIKGYKVGKATITVKVNGYAFKIKVQVTKK